MLLSDFDGNTLFHPLLYHDFMVCCSAPAAPKRRGGPGGLSKICGVSPELQVIVGEPTMARTEVLHISI